MADDMTVRKLSDGVVIICSEDCFIAKLGDLVPIELAYQMAAAPQLLEALRVAEKCIDTLLRQVTPRSDFNSTSTYENYIRISPQLVLIHEAIEKAKVQR